MTGLNLGEIPRWHAQHRPDAVAVVYGETAVSWQELARNVARKARALRALGLRRNDVVTVAMPSGIAFFEAIYAVWMAGGTLNPLSDRLPPQEFSALMELAKPRLIISEQYRDISRFPVLPPNWGDDAEDDRFQPEQAADHWKMMASGGSTGLPKLIVDGNAATTDPERYELFDQGITADRLGRRNGVMLNPGPLYHNGPFTISLRNMFAGSTIVGLTRFDPEATLREIERRKVEFAYLVPTMMNRIWKLPAPIRSRYNVSSLKGILHTAAPCARELKKHWIDWLGGERIWETYGATETSAFTLIDGEEWLRRPGSVGRMHRGKAKICDESGQVMQPGEIGQIWLMPPDSAGGRHAYLGAERQNREGWETVGDLGWMDAEGYLYIADRRADLIIRGGVNIYPAEIEAVLESHPGVLEAAVIGVPDEDLGAKIHAIVQLRPGFHSALDESTLRDFVRQRLVAYKVPATVEFITQGLRNEAGKVSRSALRSERLDRR